MQSLTPSQKSEWNAAQPISRLPPELLTRIFNILRITCELDREWLILITICKQWKNVALDCPSLWVDNTEFQNIAKTKTFLERSKEASIRVSLPQTLSLQLIPSLIEVLLPHMKRVLSLSVTVQRSTTDWHRLQELFKNLGPDTRLKSLNIYSTNGRRRRNIELPSSLCFDEDIASSLNVRLHELTLCGFLLPWNHQILKNLFRLQLMNIPDQAPSLSEYFVILESCPNLRGMHLSNAGPRSSPKKFRHPLHLSQLEDITLLAIDFVVCTELLNAIVVPPEVKCVIECVNYPFSHPRLLFPNLLSHRNQCKELSIVFYERKVEFNLCSEEWIGDIGGLSPKTISLKWNDSPDLELGIVEILSSIPVIMSQSSWRIDLAVSLNLTVTSQTARHASAMSKVVWSCLFDFLPKMKKLYVEFPEAYSEITTMFTSALMEPVNLNVTHSFRCAELEEICFVYAGFNLVRERGPYEDFLKHLKDRSEHGKRLKKFKLEDCLGIDIKNGDQIKRMNIADEFLFKLSFEPIYNLDYDTELGVV